MLLTIGIILLILGALFFTTIILLASEKDFFKLILINTVLLVIYLFIAQKFALFFSDQDIFGDGKLWFLLICLSIQVVFGFVHAVRRKSKHLTQKRLLLAKKKQENALEKKTVE